MVLPSTCVCFEWRTILFRLGVSSLSTNDFFFRILSFFPHIFSYYIILVCFKTTSMSNKQHYIALFLERDLPWRMQQHVIQFAHNPYYPTKGHVNGKRFKNETNKIEFRALNENIFGCVSHFTLSLSLPFPLSLTFAIRFAFVQNISHLIIPFFVKLHLNSATKTHISKQKMTVLLVGFFSSSFFSSHVF